MAELLVHARNGAGLGSGGVIVFVVVDEGAEDEYAGCAKVDTPA
jgi:hypothetical protein